jgi:NTP pyrophosphatase (non-canonical NTP hydrolase)
VKKVKNSNNIVSFQKLMEQIYFQRDKRRGIDSTFLWLIEEVGELSRAIKNKNEQNIREEFGDVLAWLCSLANLANINLIEVAYEKYQNKCPRCNKTVCKCPE